MMKGYPKNIIGIGDSSRGMGFIWDKYLSENKEITDCIDYHKNYGPLCFQDLLGDRLLVIMQGIPGLGKTTLAKEVKIKMGDICETLEQDSFKGSNSGKQCFYCL